MASSISDSLQLTRYGRFLIRSYRWYHSALLIIVLSYFIAIQMGSLNILHSFFTSLIIFAIPAYISAALCVLFARSVGEKFRLRTNMFLSLVVLFFISLGYSIINLSAHIFHIETMDAFIILIAYGVWLRYAYISIMVIRSGPPAIVIAATQPVISIVGYAALYGMDFSKSELFTLTLITALVLSYIFIKLIDVGLKMGTYGAGVDLIRSMVEYEMEGSERAKKLLEGVFSGFAESASIYMNFIGFSRRRGNIGLLVHTAHPGPFGTVGGSNLPHDINERIHGWEILSPHGASSHDFNPVGQSEKEKLLDAVEDIIVSGLKKGGTSQPIVHSAEYDGIPISLMGQKFGDTFLVTETFSPEETEDVDPSIAYISAEKLSCSLAFVDAHNSCRPTAKKVDFGSLRANAIIDSIATLSGKEIKETTEIRVGIGRSAALNGRGDIGPEGIKALVVETDGVHTAYILIDGNNMAPGLRERIISHISSSVDFSEVLTTDNHVVNTVSSGYNPVGQKDEDEIIEVCEQVVSMALNDLEEAEVLTGSKEIKLSVFGSCTMTKILSTSRTISALFVFLLLLDSWIAFIMAVFLAILL